MAVIKKYGVVLADITSKVLDNKTGIHASITPRAQQNWNAKLGAQAVIGEAGKDDVEFRLQRRKRMKSHATSKLAPAGDRFIARLNAAKKIDWTTIGIIKSERKDFLLNIQPGEREAFMADATTRPGPVLDAAQTELIEQEQLAIAQIVASGKDATAGTVEMRSLGDLSSDKLATAGEKLFDALTIGALNVSQISDEFKYSGEADMHISPYASMALKTYKGQAFNVETNAASDGILPALAFSPVNKAFLNDNFDAFNDLGVGNDEKIVAIVMEPTSYFNSGTNRQMKQLNEHLLDEDFVGHSYAWASQIVDPKRIVIYTAKTATNNKEMIGDSAI